MSEPFLAEVRMVGFNFAPRGWAFCDGQILPINQNQSLYSLLGTTYGGDGRTSFALPDLRGRTPIHVGTGFLQGQKSGEETHTLSVAEIPEHTHAVNASINNNTSANPSNLAYAGAAERTYSTYNAAQTTPLASSILGNVGSGQSHENMQPSLAINFCIALQGLFPSRN
ncbi:MAG: tail fiber protein [Methylococcales bacterium]